MEKSLLTCCVREIVRQLIETDSIEAVLWFVVWLVGVRLKTRLSSLFCGFFEITKLKSSDAYYSWR